MTPPGPFASAEGRGGLNPVRSPTRQGSTRQGSTDRFPAAIAMARSRIDSFSPRRGKAVEDSRMKLPSRSFLPSPVLACGILALLALSLQQSARAEPHIVYVLAEKEYGTLETVPRFHEEVLAPEGYTATFIEASHEPGVRDDLSGLAEALERADLCFLSVRRRAPEEEDMQALIDFVAAGKPLVAIRTSSHAFHLRGEPAPEGRMLWEAFDPEILGGNYHGHYGDEPAEVSVVESAADHPVLAGVGPLPPTSKLYEPRPLREAAKPLLVATIEGKESEPVAWTHRAGGKRARVFYTSLGLVEEFENTAFRKLLENAVSWALADD